MYVLSTGTYEYRAFYKSTDSGVNFEEMSDAPNIMGWSASGDGEGGQAWYDLCLEADPVVVDRVYAGGIRMKRSDDAGVTWLDIQDSYLHVDQHDLTANPHTNEIWLANDGGIYRYANNQQWEDRSHADHHRRDLQNWSKSFCRHQCHERIPRQWHILIRWHSMVSGKRRRWFRVHL